MMAACGSDETVTPDAAASQQPVGVAGPSDDATTDSDIRPACSYVTLEDVTRVLGPGFVGDDGNTDSSCGYSQEEPPTDVSELMIVSVSTMTEAEAPDIEAFARMLAGQAEAFSGSATDLEDLKNAPPGHAEEVSGVGDEAWAAGTAPFQTLVLRFGDVRMTIAVHVADGQDIELAKEFGRAAAEAG